MFLHRAGGQGRSASHRGHCSDIQETWILRYAPVQVSPSRTLWSFTMFKHKSAVSSDVHHALFKRMNTLQQTLKKHRKAEQFKASSVSCLQSAWSPNCPGSTWPTRCGSRSRICSTGSMGRHWASSTRSKCLTRGSRTTPTRSSSRAFPPASPSGSPAPSAPRTWRGSWPSPTKSVSPSPGGNARSHDLSHTCGSHQSFT